MSAETSSCLRSALAFFSFATAEDQPEFGPDLAPSPLRHIALNIDGPTQAELDKRIAVACIVEPQTYILEHGYCRSVKVNDPDGMIVEFTRDAHSAEQINAARRKDAQSELKRWLAGDHTPNNDVRHFADEGAH
jgi:glyoxylase I family protein